MQMIYEYVDVNLYLYLPVEAEVPAVNQTTFLAGYVFLAPPLTPGLANFIFVPDCFKNSFENLCHFQPVRSEGLAQFHTLAVVPQTPGSSQGRAGKRDLCRTRDPGSSGSGCRDSRGKVSSSCLRNHCRTIPVLTQSPRPLRSSQANVRTFSEHSAML